MSVPDAVRLAALPGGQPVRPALHTMSTYIADTSSSNDDDDNSANPWVLTQAPAEVPRAKPRQALPARYSLAPPPPELPGRSRASFTAYVAEPNGAKPAKAPAGAGSAGSAGKTARGKPPANPPTLHQELHLPEALLDQPASSLEAAVAQARAGTAAAPRRARSASILALQARAFKHDRFSHAATSVANELARALGCDRVSIGFVDGSTVRVAAMSNTADIGKRQALVRALGAAMDEAVNQRECLAYPPNGHAGMVADALPAHAELAALTTLAALAAADDAQTAGRSTHSVPVQDLPTICSVPIIGVGGPRGGSNAVGALLLERAQGFDAAALEAAKDAATFVGPILALKHRLDQPVSGRIVDAVAPRHAGRLRWGRGHGVAVGVGLVLAALLLWPATFRVVAPARIEGLGQQVLAAPFDGYVALAPLRPGVEIKAGQLLLSLEDRDLQLEAAKLGAEIAQLEKKYREAHSTDDAAQIVLARSRLAQAQAQGDLVQRQLARTAVRAPFDGVLLAGDFSQSLGAPVKRGQELLTVAPSRQYRVVVEVDEQDVARLQPGQQARLLFGAISGDALAMSVTRIAPLASVVDGRNVFEVDGQLNDAPAALRPGLRGVARIDIEPRLQGWIWWHRASHWLRAFWWRLNG